MSKRAGRFVTLRDVVEEVGKDVVRFIMLTRRNDAPLDFDFAKVDRAVASDNPVFYVQYAHARTARSSAMPREAIARVELGNSRLMGILLNPLTDLGNSV